MLHNPQREFFPVISRPPICVARQYFTASKTVFPGWILVKPTTAIGRIDSAIYLEHRLRLILDLPFNSNLYP
jgi:hypothetical protein